MFSYHTFQDQSTLACLVPLLQTFLNNQILLIFFNFFIELFSVGLFPYPLPPPQDAHCYTPQLRILLSNLCNFLTKCFIPRVFKAGVWYVGEQEDSFTCLCLCKIKKEFPVEKHESSIGFEEDQLVCLIFTLFIYFFTVCNTNCSTTVKYQKNMPFFKNISVLFIWRPTAYWTTDPQTYTQSTHLTMVMVYLIELISRVYSSHQFKLQTEHRRRLDMRLSSLSRQFEQPQCTLEYNKNSFYRRTIVQCKISHLKLQHLLRHVDLGNPCESVHI